jgi:hypothetical protein
MLKAVKVPDLPAKKGAAKTQPADQPAKKSSTKGKKTD